MKSKLSIQETLYLGGVLTLTLLSTACGGGGSGNVRVGNPTPPPSDTNDPPESKINAPSKKHLTDSNALPALNAGLTGKGFSIGIVDTGVNSAHPALKGRVTDNLVYVGSGNNLGVDAVNAHGTAVAQIAAGTENGVAPGTTIVSARTISDDSGQSSEPNQGYKVGSLSTQDLSLAGNLERINTDFIKKNVNIMNNSWGGIDLPDSNATDTIVSVYEPFIKKHNGLVVFAAGNSEIKTDDPSKTNPGDIASLPSQIGANGKIPGKILESGWLTVVALDPKDTLADYSYKCGIAANYCLGAPGTIMTSGIDGKDLYTWSGTSMAAPMVSGAAALVWEAFPYFTNDLVRQTILGTATDIGEKGVDAVYGYGSLNIGKAVLGPAQLNWGNVNVNFSGSSIWGNNISGAGGIVKDGNGTLTLKGDNTYTGGTQILGGTVVSNSNLNSGVQINPQGRFVIGRQVAGNINNYGKFEASNGNTSVIKGDYEQGPNAEFRLLVGSYVNVEGKAKLGGGNLHVLGLKNGYAYKQRETFLTTTQGLTGTFTNTKPTAETGVFLDATIGYDAKNAWLDITRLDVATKASVLGGITAASQESAVRVENAFQAIDNATTQSDNPNIDYGFLALAGQIQTTSSEKAAVKSLESLSGQLHLEADQLTLDSIATQRRALSGRFDQLISQPRNNSGAWYQGFNKQSSFGFNVSNSDLNGWMMGADTALNNNTVAGFAVSQVDGTRQGVNQSGQSTDRQLQGQFYLGSVQGNRYQLGQIGVGHYDRQMERALQLGQGQHAVNANYAGTFITANAETGIRLKTKLATVTPYMGVSYVKLNRDAFQEVGASGFGLKANASQSEQTQGLFGLRAERNWQTINTNFRLNGYTEWQQNLASKGMTMDASFVGVDSWSNLSSPNFGESGGVLGLSFDALLRGKKQFSVGYDQRFGYFDNSPRVWARFNQSF